MPTFANQHVRNRLTQATDASILIQSFADTPHLARQFPRYQGLLDISLLPTPCSLVPASVKMSVLRGLAAGASSSAGAGGMENNLAFRLKRKRLVIETLHLDAGEQTEQAESSKSEKVLKKGSDAKARIKPASEEW